MHGLYTIGIYCYGMAIRIASGFNPKAREWVSGRKNWRSTLPDPGQKKVIWFHCASLGEFDQGLPLMQRIRRDQPNAFLLVTFFSPSGMQHYHKRQHPADHVMYLPLDTPGNAHAFIRHFRPELAFFVKYEFWSNFIFAASAQGTRLFNISGLFREKHRFFKWYGGFFRATLRRFEWFFVQNQSSLELLHSIGIRNASVAGDSRFDRVIENRKLATGNPILEQFAAGEKMLIAGSSWPEDERMLAGWAKSYAGKLLIAPHSIDDSHIRDILQLFPDAVRYTHCTEATEYNTRVMILDTIGQLANAYAYGYVAYVGGGFSGSLHNILEPAVFGLPVIFGPKHERFPEARQFIDAGIGFSVSTAEEFGKAFESLRQTLPEISRKTTEFVQANQGAADRIWTHISSS